MQAKTNIFHICLNFDNLLNLINNFLTIKDLKSFSETCKTFKSNFQHLIKNKLNEKFNLFVNQLIKKPKKFKIITTPINTIIKMNFFEIPSNILISKVWKHIDSNDKWLQSVIKEEKFIKENQNLFFANDNGDVLFMNRTFLDENLLINKLTNDNQEEEVKKETYEKLYSGNELTSECYDFTNIQSLLQRQKHLTSNIEFINKKFEKNNNFETNLQNLSKISRISFILCHGGHFSLAIFDQKGKCILHKSDHKYVTRKKAGQRQLGKDKQSGSNIKSIGSQIRRENEKIHQITVSKILSDNISDIEKSDLILLQAPGINRLLLIDENKPLALVKDKIRSICLTAKKANYVEIEKIFSCVSKVYIIKKN